MTHPPDGREARVGPAPRLQAVLRSPPTPCRRSDTGGSVRSSGAAENLGRARPVRSGLRRRARPAVVADDDLRQPAPRRRDDHLPPLDRDRPADALLGRHRRGVGVPDPRDRPDGRGRARRCRVDRHGVAGPDGAARRRRLRAALALPGRDRHRTRPGRLVVARLPARPRTDRARTHRHRRDGPRARRGGLRGVEARRRLGAVHPRGVDEGVARRARRRPRAAPSRTPSGRGRRRARDHRAHRARRRALRRRGVPVLVRRGAERPRAPDRVTARDAVHVGGGAPRARSRRVLRPRDPDVRGVRRRHARGGGGVHPAHGARRARRRGPRARRCPARGASRARPRRCSHSCSSPR